MIKLMSKYFISMIIYLRNIFITSLPRHAIYIYSMILSQPSNLLLHQFPDIPKTPGGEYSVEEDSVASYFKTPDKPHASPAISTPKTPGSSAKKIYTPKTPESSAKKIGENFFHICIQNNIVTFFRIVIRSPFINQTFNVSEAAKKFNPPPGQWARDLRPESPRRESPRHESPKKLAIDEEDELGQSDLYVHRRLWMLGDPESKRRHYRDPSPPRADVSKYPRFSPRHEEEGDLSQPGPSSAAAASKPQKSGK